MGKLVLLGGGGHCLSILDSIDKQLYDDILIIDTNENLKEIQNIAVFHDEECLESLYFQGFHYAFISIGSIGNTNMRKTLYNKLKKIGFEFVNIIDKSSAVSPESKFDRGVFVGKNAVVNSGVIIGKNSIVNSGAIIEHQTKIGEFCHIAPGAVVLGGCTIKNNVHIGANATIKQNTTIEDNVIVGMGSVVLHDLSKNIIVYGNPAKSFKENKYE